MRAPTWELWLAMEDTVCREAAGSSWGEAATWPGDSGVGQKAPRGGLASPRKPPPQPAPIVVSAPLGVRDLSAVAARDRPECSTRAAQQDVSETDLWPCHEVCQLQ